MATLNYTQLLMALKSNNPRQVATTIIQNNFPTDPTFQSLLQLANNNDIKGLEKFAQDYLSKQGLDLNTELQNLLTAVNNL